MKTIAYPNACIYEFQVDIDLVERLFEKITVSKLNYDIEFNENNPTQIATFVDDECNSVVTKYISLVSNLHFPSLHLAITDSWVHKSEYGTQLKKHKHNNSVLSAILYLTDHPNTKLHFYIPDSVSQRFDTILGRYHEHKLTIEPAKGKLLIFDSGLYHSVDNHTHTQTRYSLAFNTFFTGKINVMSNGMVSKRDHLFIELKSKKDTP